MFNVWKDGIVIALQLLTIIPFRKRVDWEAKRIEAAVASFPVVGLILGTSLAACFWLVSSFDLFSPLFLTVFLMTISLLYSGGLHLDGWADFHDAVMSRRSKAEKLAIMDDPRLGTFGLLSVLLLLGWRFVFMFEAIRAGSTLELLLALFLIPFLSRVIMGWQLLLGPFAKKEGMAKAFEPAKTRRLTYVYVSWTVLGFFLSIAFYPLFVSLTIAASIFTVFWLKWVTFHLGGITGDTLGAAEEGGETLLWAVVSSLLLFVTV